MVDKRQDHCQQRCRERCPDDHLPPVAAIGHISDEPLNEAAAEDDHCHEQGHPEMRKADSVQVDGSERVECPHDEAVSPRAENAKRRQPYEPA